MCQHENCTGEYGKAYAKSESVSLAVSAICPRCPAVRMEEQAHVHLGGEIWVAPLKCLTCGFAMWVTVVPKAVFLARR